MSISDFIRDSVLRERLKKAAVIVVYDLDRRYRELCHQLADEVVSRALCGCERLNGKWFRRSVVCADYSSLNGTAM